MYCKFAAFRHDETILGLIMKGLRGWRALCFNCGGTISREFCGRGGSISSCHLSEIFVRNSMRRRDFCCNLMIAIVL